jgi:hypothetical protein
MADPRLNSVHLEMPRRQEFRRARDVVLGARGWQTVAVEVKDDSSRPPTAHERIGESVGKDVRVWLVDRDYVYPLHIGLNTVGRAPENDVIIHDGYVSRRHCAILVHSDNRVELFDIASKNGTYLNGNKLHSATALKPGDEIRMCDRQLIFMTHSADQMPGTHTATIRD